ncbi:hypothetical protein ACH4KU_34265 [Streptomyces althioticus]|uniref:hypothetical protein n=1 Tax=Streptomyces althioticus TaxID=83380 RepID=UPI0037A810A0
MACWFSVDRSTITRAIAEVRPLLAERGCTVSPGVRLRTLAEVIDHLAAIGKTGIIDGTEIRVRRRQSGARTGTGSSPARASRTRSRPWSSRTGTAACCSAARPGPAAAPTSPTRASWGWSAPGRRTRGGDARRRRLPGPGSSDRRPCDHTTTPQV